MLMELFSGTMLQKGTFVTVIHQSQGLQISIHTAGDVTTTDKPAVLVALSTEEIVFLHRVALM